jgi:hypothetical protein
MEVHLISMYFLSPQICNTPYTLEKMWSQEGLLTSIFSFLCCYPCLVFWQNSLDPCGRSLSLVHYHIGFLEFHGSVALTELYPTQWPQKLWNFNQPYLKQFKCAIWRWIASKNTLPIVYDTLDLKKNWVHIISPKLLAFSSYSFD